MRLKIRWQPHSRDGMVGGIKALSVVDHGPSPRFIRGCPIPKGVTLPTETFRTGGEAKARACSRGVPGRSPSHAQAGPWPWDGWF